MTDFVGTKEKWIIKHSESKTAFNICRTQVGENYKIARIPYIVVPDSIILSERARKEAFANALLVVKSLEMFDMLKNLIPILKDRHLYESAEKAEKLIKEATNI